MPTTIEIFCCYAREDQDLMEKLGKHLISLQRRGLITIRSDTDIDAGTAWEEEIKKHLDSAHIILLLISPDFMASDYCYSTEMKRAIERHEKKEARVIPIILRHSDWKGTPIDKLQITPTNARPVTDRRSWQNTDEALNDVFQHIEPIVIELLLPLYIDEATELVKKGYQDDALAVYELALRLEPRYAAALYGKGEAYFHLERYTESITAFKQAIEAAPDKANAHTHYYRARAFRELKSYNESLAAYDEVLRFNAFKHVYEEKAELLLQLKRNPKALEVYEQLLKLDPQNADYLAQKGFILRVLKRDQEALEAYIAAIQIDSKNADFYFNAGEISFRLGLFKDSAYIFEQAIILNPQIAIYHENKGKALLALKRFEEALTAYENCIKLSTDPNPYQFHGKGQALLGLERYEEAITAYDRAINLSGDNPIPQFYHDKGVVYKRLAEQASKMEKQARVKMMPRPEELTLLRTYSEHSGDINSIAISLDGRLLASGGGKDKTIKLWDLLSGKEFGTIRMDSNVNSVAISPDKQLLAGSADNAIKIWSLLSGKELLTLNGHSGSVTSVAISPDGLTLASGGKDSTIKLWNLQTGKLLHTFAEHSEQVHSVTISPDEQTLASGSRDTTIKMWNLLTWQELRTIQTEPKADVASVSFSPDGRLLVSKHGDGTIRVWGKQ